MFFCGIFFSWSLLYYDSCPLPVKITSPGTHSSSRAHGLQANTSSPGLSTTVHCTNVHVHVYAWHYKAIKERLLLLPDNSFPFVFLFSVCSLRPLQFLCVSWNPGNVASSQCCCVLDQELLVLEWGGHASPLRKEGAWRDHSTLIACQNIHRSGGKKENEKGPGVAERTKRLLWSG